MKKTNGHRKPRGFTYRSYSFKDKDPVIYRVKTILKDEGIGYNEAHIISGVSASTFTNWFDGETKRPQYATVAAITSALGYKQEFVKDRKINYEVELEKARGEIKRAAAAAAKR